VWKRYIRVLTRQESFEYNGLERAEQDWIDSHDPPLHLSESGLWVTPGGTVCEPPESLGIVPSDWRPDEDDPTWEFVYRSHPDALPYWVVGDKEDIPPPNPSTPAKTKERA
jgi:hypothetical protein